MTGSVRSITDLDWPVRTERLSLRPAEQRDALTLFAFRTLPEVSHWTTTQVTDRDAWEASFGDRLSDTLIVELGGVVIGDLMLRFEDPWSQLEVREQAARTQVEIGYSLDPAYVGRGYATEAVRAELRICFEDIGVRRVTASCFADNVASWRLMERVGMRREQYAVQDSLHRDGRWLDGMTYALLRDEWLSSRGAPAGSAP